MAQAERLLWRAGFGPSPGHAEALAGMGLHRAVAALTRPEGPETFTGAAPTDGDGNPLAPEDLWGHDHLWFLDRMVRTNHPLVQRMTLVWHDWFATSNDGVGQQNLMLAQNELFRRHALGSFDTLVHDVTADPAMIVWLNLDQNTRWAPNENYARELMELFTLGADRGAYSEDDVRELARALTGWDSDWADGIGYHNFRFVQSRHDATNKTVFGQTGNFRWEQAAAMCVRHPMHPSFFVSKLWSYFIPVPPSDGDRAALETLYVSSGYQVRPLLEAILLHPQLHAGPRMVKPPAVFVAGMLRALRRAVDTDAWVWLMEGAGQRLFYPPDVAGWNDERWLDTSTVRGRWEIVGSGLYPRQLTDAQIEAWDPAETADDRRGARALLLGRSRAQRRDRGRAHRLRERRRVGLAGRLAAGLVPRPAPERPAPPPVLLPRPPDELMATCGCNDYSRSRLLRRAAAEAGRGLPRSSRACRSPRAPASRAARSSRA